MPCQVLENTKMWGECFLNREHILLLIDEAQLEEQVSQCTVICEEVGDDTTDNNRRYEVGHVADGLNDFLEVLVLNFVEEQCKDNRCGEVDDHGVNTKNEGVSNQTPQVVALEEIDKVLQAYPFTEENTASGCVILECEQYTAHGYIVPNKEVQNNRNCKKVD